MWLLLVVTLLAVGGWWVVSRARDDGRAADDGSAPTTERGSQLPPIAPAGQSVPVFLDGPVAPPVNGVPEVAVPPLPDDPPIEATATYRSSVAGTSTCLVAGFATGRTVTIANLDNGRTVTCLTTTAPAEQREDVILHTVLFAELADLTDAPIPVEIRP
jgi:hypothetical protein